MKQAELTLTTRRDYFDGETYSPKADRERLSEQLRRVKWFMADQQWHRLREIAEAAQASEASVSARLRDLRKSRFGCYRVERRRVGDAKRGLYEYRVLPPLCSEEAAANSDVEALEDEIAKLNRRLQALTARLKGAKS